MKLTSKRHYHNSNDPGNEKQSDSYYDVKCTTVYFHENSNNSQSNSWIRLKLYMKSLDLLLYLKVKFQVNQSSRRHRNTGQQRLYEFCYLLHFFFGKLTYVLKEEDTNIIRGIPQIYNDNRNIKQQMATG